MPVDDPVQRCPDITLATTLLAWRPTTPLADGLAQTITYFDKLLSERSLPAAVRALHFSASAGRE